MRVKLDEDSSNPEIGSAESRNRLSLPQGLFGFSGLRERESDCGQEELPCMWLREDKKDG